MIEKDFATWPTEKSHHRFSPSTLQSREACPCYESRNTAHVRAIAGTLAHGVVESGTDDNALSDEDATAAAECLDFVNRRRQLLEDARGRALTEWYDRYPGDPLPGAFPAIQELKEVELPIDDCKFDDGSLSTTSGYVDNILLDHTGTYAELFDWKFGRWLVETADNNLQGISYSLGAFYRYPKLNAIRFFFKQPYADSISEATFTRDQVPALYLRVQTVVARAREAVALAEKNDWSRATPMVPACNFCSNIGRCEKVAAFVCSVGSKFYPVEIPEDITPSLIHSPNQTSLGLRLAHVVKTWADSYRTQVTNRVLEGRAELPEGYSIQSMSKRELVDKVAFRAIALKYLTEAEYTDALAVTFGAIESTIADHAARGSKKSTIEQFQAELENAGATRKGEPFSFLRSKPTKER